jgi:hypothetical protein
MSSLLPILLAVSSMIAQSPFEGMVESKNTTTDELGALQQFTMTIWVREGRVRISMSAFGSDPGTTILYYRDRGLTLMLDDQERTYFEIRQSSKSPGDQRLEAPSQSNIRRTGKARKILGYPCDQLIARDGDAQTEYWATKGLSSLAETIASALGGDGNEAGAGVKDELAAMGYFPLIARTKLEGNIIESTEVTKIQKHRFADSLFELPAGYKKQSFQDMMQEPGK